MAVLETHIIKIKHVVDGKGLDKARAEARKAAEEIEQAFDKAADGSGDAADDMADAHEDAAKKTSEVWTGALRQVGARLVDFGIQGAAAIAGFIADTFTDTRELDLFAQTLGVSTRELSALEKGFERARVPAGDTREAIKTLRENLGELDRTGTGPALESLQSLGLELSDFKGKTPTEQLKVLASALQNVEDPMKRTSIAIQLMGEDGQKIMPAMLDGAAGVQAFTDAAREAGQVLDEETIQATRDLDDALLDAKGQAEGIALAVLTAAVPALTEGADGMKTWIGENQELIDQGVPAAIDLIGAAASGAATAILTLASAYKDLQKWSDALPGAKAMLEMQGVTLDENGNRVSMDAQPTRRETAQAAFAEQFPAALQERQEAEIADMVQGLRDDAVVAGIRAGKAREAEARIKGKGKDKTPKGKGKKKDREAEQAEALELFRGSELGAELQQLGEDVSATPKAIEAALVSAMRSVDGGAAAGVARKRGQGSLSGNVGFDVSKRASMDPLSQLFGIDAAPDASVHDITGGAVPNVLTMTINNTFTIDMPVSIDGSDRPDLVPDQLVSAFNSLLDERLQRESKYAKVGLAR